MLEIPFSVLQQKEARQETKGLNMTNLEIIVLICVFAAGYVVSYLLEFALHFCYARKEQKELDRDDWVDADYMDDEHDFEDESGILKIKSKD
jgi:hypothetical protein